MLAHAKAHSAGGGDAIKLDDLAAPDDNADLNASTATHGLLRKLSGVSTEYLSGTGVFSTPAGGGGGGPDPSNTVVNEINYGQGSDIGSLATYSRGDHTHGSPIDPIPAHVAASNPHTQYVLGTDPRLSDARVPTLHAASHAPGGSDALAVDAAGGTGSLRTLGTAGTSACAGNDARLSDARTPLVHATSHQNGGSDALSVLALSGYPGGTATFLRADGAFAAPPGGGSFSAVQVTVNLPYPASRRHSVNVIDAAMTATDKILLSLAGVPETQANASDGIDPLAWQALPKDGSFDLQVSFLTPAAGPLTVSYARAA